MYKITLIPGDGIGPEISEAMKKVVEATGVPVEWEIENAGEEVYLKEGTPLPTRVTDSIKKNKIAIKGPITTPVGTGFRSVNVTLRQTLDLYACVRPCKSFKGARTKYENIDLVIVRENTEDLYAGIEFKKGESETIDLINFIEKKSGRKIREDSGISIKPISVFGTERIVRFAFEFARKNSRKKVTAVHKANIMKYTDGLFLEVARQVAQKYPDIEFEDRIVDNMCMQLVQKPELYDVLVLPNLYGDIISDLAAGLIGGLGLAPGANIGDEYAVFEPTHGSAPKYKGLNKVNPFAMILSAVMMLRHIGEFEAANKIERAVAEIIEEGKVLTYDMKSSDDSTLPVGTQEVALALVEKIKKF
ncbi:MAG TPA: isocitrate/isopropylmalate dehydrogenase family protein [Thermodesulfovibrio thiophilus]|uniref:isocitrate/isopropylmalate dehydrogenase family protein n=1 Tax=Thermodesulfovibrio thiophilus TaxID=340095 RepID=UPI0003FF32E0|nr:isocitrate/isopropylmalate dehydrogenase family protein [Thermodesulfovibrio thiophilus]HHW20941.1 isocitrate/isopropylmalate dehydrogenase family protein [Thermodesulfovibrio thiophilus]HOA83208.1 isocitrate/isopropylmalate dehydrogenase family protein [Thermodesulfovibrio thiophilus]HQA04229.1 isocitrate/isopropylmalate dehydrogenase family protein [Thermodesulfovibrio thiophilus]HQD36254.1 isocitrate/isopropylmalate dehydrogenase family protein [Thermodesulfovibrio thiophilus]